VAIPLNKKTIVLYVIALLLLILMLWYVGVQQIVANLQSVNVPILALAALMHSFSILLRGIRWKYILSSCGSRISTLNSYGLIYLGWFANGLVPAKVGDVVRVFDIRKENSCPLGKGFASLVIERIFDTVVIVSLVVLSTLFVSRALGYVSSSGWVTLSIVLGVVLASGLAVFAVLCIKKQDFIAGVFVRLFGSRRAKDMKGFTKDLATSFTGFGSRKRILLLITLLSLAIWLVNFPKFYVVFISMGLYPELTLVAAATFISDAWGMVPITPGGIGSVEIGQTLFVIWIVGITPTALAAAVVLLDRIVSFWIPMLIGGIVSVKKGTSLTFRESNETKMPVK
jgi:uncharacterized protein (TIRG00374 family)